MNNDFPPFHFSAISLKTAEYSVNPNVISSRFCLELLDTFVRNIQAVSLPVAISSFVPDS